VDYSPEVFLNHTAQTTPFPFGIPVERAEGIYLFTPDGRRYTDFISGIGVSNLGHRHPSIVKAIRDQLDRHLHVMVYGEYIQSPVNRLAARLASLLPPGLNCCYFVNSGTEANEGALKLARRFTGRSELVSFRGSYHGSTTGSMSVSGNEKKKGAFRPLLPDVRFLNFSEVRDLKHITNRTAGVIMEAVQGDAGVRVPSREFMKALRDRCTETGALLILDEIQTGMGRTGTLYAFEQFGIVPDILTTAKALGGGLPLGAFVSDKKIMRCLTDDPMLGHITTFGGNPVCCASALAVLETIQKEDLLRKAEAKGKLIEDLLKHPRVKELRRIGLFFALDFDSEETVQKIVRYCLDKRVICFWFLSCPWSFRIAPPLTISEDEIRESCAVLREAFDRA
jgi:acetylornithine/succinyldiaminopimelate/putrescine aminotransferase